MVEVMQKCGLQIECHHHEVATGGQCEIDQRFDTLVKSADNMMTYKYCIRNVGLPPESVERRQASVCG